MSDKEHSLKNKSFQFALKIVNLYKKIRAEKREFVMSKRLLPSGTSVGANIREAQNAQSKADFVHKLSIAQKECDETLYWLELLCRSDYLTEEEYKSLNFYGAELLKMLRSSIITTKKNHNL